ncbi:hypothetical protein [Lichenibacterium dinghuense]|uniref:hypothetical protein n=1 Tax=Lichenibacterium dinghuense TaxID=2895977 RepID=UPI001F18F960|nr:hypothetical protein [Lichenibacterium sp. 6Y81]
MSVRRWKAASALAASVLAGSVVPARADWQYTRWGMTPDQVTAASNAAAQPNPDRRLDADGLKAALTAPYQGAAIPFTAVFLFDPENRLQVVTLDPVGGIACPVIVQALVANHGAPENDADPLRARTLRWDDADNDNLVVYADLGEGSCTIQYSRLPPTRPDGKGL